MTAYEIIAKKRDNRILTKKEIHFFINEYLKGTIKDYQMSALLMAVFFNGMNDEELFAITESYLNSGKILDLSEIPGIKIDKHSTGGVGDKVSIVLAPLAASLGVPVPMISGRALGHTGGTLDKLESIPGFNVFSTLEQFKKQVSEIGVAMLGQTDSIVPADRQIYALRDVTATVESIPLITASIMSKKIAEGIDGLVLDVKFGNGAFMKEPEKAELLATYLIKVGKAFNKKMVAHLTAMDQPLGYKIGNWLEILECLDCFHGKGPDDLMEVILTLTPEMLVLGERAKTVAEARTLCERAISDGSAFEKFLEMVDHQGGDTSYIENPDKYQMACNKQVIKADRAGYITAFDSREIGLASVQLGAGRKRADDPVDPSAGIILFKKIGDKVSRDEPIMEMHSNDDNALIETADRLISTVTIEENKPADQRLLLKRLND